MATDIPSVAILGGGPAGLAFARILELNNISYIVYERDASSEWALGLGGSGSLDLHANSGQLALKAAGLFDQFKQLSRNEGHNVIAGPQDNVIVDWGSIEDADRPEIDRKDLRVMLLKSIPEEKIIWNKKVQHVRKDDKGAISVEFTDGGLVSGFKLVVGADGTWSKTRALLTDAKPRYSGLHYIGTKITPGNPIYEKVEKKVGMGNYMVFGPKKMLSAMRLSHGHYHILAGMALPESWDKNELKDVDAFRKYLVHDVYKGYAEDLTDLLTYSEDGFHDWPLWDLPPEALCWKSVPGVTVIGDAAHVTTPFMGEGVNCAMHDSYQLAQAILKHGFENLDEAVVEYEQDMFVRGKRLITGSRKNGELIFEDDKAPENFLKFMSEQMEESGQNEHF